MQPVINQHIELIPSAIHGEKACIAGTRIRVQDIYVLHELEKLSPHDIVARYPQLSLSDVHAAMVYYWDNQQLIQQQLKLGHDIAEQARQSNPAKLPPLMEGLSSNADSVSP